MTDSLTPLPDHFSLGDLRIDVGQQRVFREGSEIVLPKLSYDALLALAQAAPRPVSIDSLMSQVWPGLVVNPETVSQRIKLLRDALGDDSRQPRYIASVRGRGYKLLLAVVSRDSDRDAAPQVAAPAVAAPGVAARLILAGILAAAGISWFVADRFWVSRPLPQNATTRATTQNSIAVLPFVDMSEKHDQEYFSDGLSEELIDLLAKVPNLRVPARTSSFYFKGKQTTIAEIAQALAVNHVLEGSVRTSGSNVRVTAQLIRVDTGYHVWSETYDRKLTDIFQIQDEISNAVVQQLRASLSMVGSSRPLPTQSSEAYTAYLLAKSLFRRGGTADYQKALDQLQRAVLLDPSFAIAWSEIAWIRIRQFRLGMIPLQLASRDAHAAIDTATKIAPDLAEVLLNRGRTSYVLDWQWRQADSEFKKAMELDPNTEDLYQWSGLVAQSLGNVDTAVSLFREEAARDPLSPHAYELIGQVDLRAGKWSEAEDNFARAHALMPQMYGESFKVTILLSRGRPAEAIAALGNAQTATAHFQRSWAYQLLEQRADSDQELAILERDAGDDMPVSIAQLHAIRGETDETFKWLDRAYNLHDLDLVLIKGDNQLGSVKSDPRFLDLLNRLGLPE